MTKIILLLPLFAALLLTTLVSGTTAFAAVTFFGSVNPNPPGDGDVESTLIVGLMGDDDPSLQGFVQIDGGDKIEYDALIVGDDDGYRGELILTDTVTPVVGPSRLTLEEAGSSTAPTVQVGHEGIGQLTVAAGAQLILEDTNADVSIGVETTGIGTLTVTGNLSMVLIPATHNVGNAGIGRMEILDGGLVHNNDTSDLATIGAAATGSGTVLVDGLGSIWKIDDDLTIGGLGSGTLTVQHLGLVDVDLAGALTTIGPRGRLELSEGTFAGATIASAGFLGGSGTVRGAVTNAAGALIDADQDDLLQFTDGVTNQGAIRVRGGEVVFLASLNNLAEGAEAAPGRITLDSGRMRFSQTLTNDGVIAALDGVNHLHGAITNGTEGVITVASDSVATFYDDVNVGAGTIELLAGANALLLADLMFSSGGLAAFELGGQPTGAAQLDVGGAAALAGALEVELTGGLVPRLGDAYPLITTAGGLSGTFADVTLPALANGLEWNLNYGANDLVLQVLASAGLAGDYNNDGTVNAADYTVWRDNQGAPAGTLPNDTVGGTIGLAQYTLWKTNFGASLGSGGGLPGHQVPEPTGMICLIVALAVCGLADRLRR